MVAIAGKTVDDRVAQLRADIAARKARSAALMAQFDTQPANVPPFNPDLSSERLNRILFSISRSYAGNVPPTLEPTVPDSIPFLGKREKTPVV